MGRGEERRERGGKDDERRLIYSERGGKKELADLAKPEPTKGIQRGWRFDRVQCPSNY